MIALLALTAMVTPPPADRPTVVVVTGAPGESRYDPEFRRWTTLWKSAAAKGGAEVVAIGDDDSADATDAQRLRSAIASASSESAQPLWIVLNGHGTFDGREAKFNLKGPDVSGTELAGWLAEVHRPVVVINGGAASGPFLDRLKGENRVVVTATRSGDEQNFARFGGYLAESIAAPDADLDKDGQTSLLEAYLLANARLAEFYKTDARLATEHPLLDDNGDGLGTPADWFQGVRATKRPKTTAQPDGLRAHQLHLVPSDRERDVPPELLARRDALERQVAALRDEKASLPEDDYYARLEPLMLELARLYRDLPSGAPNPGPSTPRR